MTQAPDRIFLLSHMRAYTSLLGHILGSHPAIEGYYEMHLSYRDAGDLARQRRCYRERERPKPGARFLFDKLLHNDYLLEPERLGPERVVLLIALRPPEQTIKSIVNLFLKKGAGAVYSSPDSATRYYLERLRWLTGFALRNRRGYYYFDADLIRSDNRRTLRQLTRWLGLETPLSDRYRLFSQTGVARAGDSSRAIGSGRVITRENRYPDILLDPGLLERAMTAYESARRALADSARDTLLR